MNRRAWRAVRAQVLARDGFRCRQCGRRGRLEVDHVVALDQGGAELDPENLQALCRHCHMVKTRSERHQGAVIEGRGAWRDEARRAFS